MRLSYSELVATFLSKADPRPAACIWLGVLEAAARADADKTINGAAPSSPHGFSFAPIHLTISFYSHSATLHSQPWKFKCATLRPPCAGIDSGSAD